MKKPILDWNCCCLNKCCLVSDKFILYLQFLEHLEIDFFFKKIEVSLSFAENKDLKVNNRVADYFASMAIFVGMREDKEYIWSMVLVRLWENPFLKCLREDWKHEWSHQLADWSFKPSPKDTFAVACENQLRYKNRAVEPRTWVFQLHLCVMQTSAVLVVWRTSTHALLCQSDQCIYNSHDRNPKLTWRIEALKHSQITS